MFIELRARLSMRASIFLVPKMQITSGENAFRALKTISELMFTSSISACGLDVI